MKGRRGFLVSMAAVVASAKTLSAQTITPDFGNAAIIRPPLDGVGQRMSEFALDGPYIYPSAPSVFNGEEARYFFFIPRGVKTARLIIFSHGALADPLSYADILFHWASHGFVVAAPLHDDAILESGPTLRRTIAGSVSEWDVSQLLEDPNAWENRVGRCIECVEIANEIAATSGFEIPRDRLIIAGHGYGAYITQLLMGAKAAGPGGKTMNFRDARFFAGISLSTQGPGIMGLSENSWKDVNSPMLHILSDGEDDFTGQSWEDRAQAFSLSAPGYKHLGIVREGGTNLFTRGRSGIGRTMNGYLAMKAMAACFLKAYGDYDEAAFANLGQDFFERNSADNLVEYTR